MSQPQLLSLQVLTFASLSLSLFAALWKGFLETLLSAPRAAPAEPDGMEPARLPASSGPIT